MRDYNSSKSESNCATKYANEFGEVVLEPITRYMPISEISKENVPEVEEALFSMETAEKIALITENKMIQIALPYPIRSDERAAYLVKHSSTRRAAVCRVHIKSFQTPGNVSAQEQIESMAPKTIRPIPVD